MSDNQRFIEATDFIKNTKKITFGQIAVAIGVERYILDNIRRGSQAPSAHLIRALQEIYPESAKFFALKVQSDDVANDSEERGEYVKMEPGMVHELLKMQRDMIAMLQAEIERKRLEAERLRGEIKALREMRAGGKKG